MEYSVICDCGKQLARVREPGIIRRDDSGALSLWCRKCRKEIRYSILRKESAFGQKSAK